MKPDKIIKTVILLGIGMFLLGIFIYPPAENVKAANVSRYENQYYDGTVSSMSGETHIYYFGGATPTVPYARFILRTDGGKVYNSTTEVLVAKAAITWAASEVLLIDETTTVGGWLINVPEGDSKLPDGWYDVMIYECAAATPASTDTLYLGRTCYIDDGNIISFDDR